MCGSGLGEVGVYCTGLDLIYCVYMLLILPFVWEVAVCIAAAWYSSTSCPPAPHVGFGCDDLVWLRLVCGGSIFGLIHAAKILNGASFWCSLDERSVVWIKD